MAFNKLEIFGGCDVNYILNENVELSESIISDLTQNAIHSPEWGFNTELLAIFNDSTNGGNLNNDNIISYRIQKRNIKENIMRTVANVDASDTKIIDFNIANNEVYKYYIVPIIEIDGIRGYGRTVEISELSMDWDSWSVIGLREIESNIYEVDYDNIWIFKLNLEPGDYTVNIGKTFSDGIGRFPKSFTNSNNYVKGKLSCYMGDVNCVSEYINDDAMRIEKWNMFCNSSDLKLIRDTKGNIYLADIESASFLPSDYANGKPTKITFDFVQLADTKDACIFKVVS